ncbi:hypothetical protein [Streptomyces tendae]|uniref:hypothetical protein n=1 Tax=Streptomyces tendae TaxID=1932 RepID=UPI00378C9D74
MRRLAPACLALAAALLGCSSGSGSGEGGGPAGAAEKPAASGDRAAAQPVSYTSRLPIARYSYTETENAAIEYAQQLLTQRCLKSYGIAYEPEKPDQGSAESADRRYGVSNPTEAALFGYHPNPDSLRDDQVDLPKEALPVFYGNRSAAPGSGDEIRYKGKRVPDAGCFGQSVGKLSKEYDAPDAAAVASRIATGSYDESLADPAVKEVFRKWSSCMRKAGFRYASPNEPVNKSEFQGDTISAKEKKTAVADVRCKEATGLLDIWFKAESAIQKTKVRENAEALEKLSAAHRKKAAAARRIVAGDEGAAK